MDDNFMWGIKRVNEICNLLIKQKSDIKWICQGRADTIVKGGKELLDRMYNAGCIAIQIGVESPFKDRLKAVSKGINKNDAVQSIKLTLDSGILVRATYLFGFEDETKEKMRQTLDFAIENKSQFVQLGIITPFPGSPYFENIKHKMNTHDWRKLTVAHQFLDYGFDMERELAKIFIKFNFRPSYINMVGKLDINQSWGLITFIYPLTKVIAGSAIDCLYDFNPNKWCQTDEEYWQKYILKTDLTFEETWYYDKPKIDPLQIPYKPVREIYPVVKEIVPVKLPIAKWVRI